MALLNKEAIKTILWQCTVLVGFISALGFGILGGINIAFMFPEYALLLAITMITTNCFTTMMSYYYVVSSNENNSRDFSQDRPLTWKVRLFLLITGCFVMTAIPANFYGVYIGFVLVGGSLPFPVPLAALKVIGAIFGGAAALANFIYNVKVVFGLAARMQYHGGPPLVEVRVWKSEPSTANGINKEYPKGTSIPEPQALDTLSIRESTHANSH